MRRIPEATRKKALADYLDGVTPREICRRYGLHRGYVNNLWRRRGLVSQTKMREMRLWDRACRGAA